MLYFEWKEEDAIKYAKEEGFEDGMSVGRTEGAAQERIKNIRALKDVLPTEKIAETLQVPKQYVLDVLKDDGPIMACEPTALYTTDKKE